ncbi:hypothetical protein [Rugamonas sp.]|uniref:hypothetical protein n=1 Tax=Rugamonas sp. TaxID=1926287 RepID=UPI0025E510A1|nr:hypothetical protein [Rugamonas sp.]
MLMVDTFAGVPSQSTAKWKSHSGSTCEQKKRLRIAVMGLRISVTVGDAAGCVASHVLGMGAVDTLTHPCIEADFIYVLGAALSFLFNLARICRSIAPQNFKVDEKMRHLCLK